MVESKIERKISRVREDVESSSGHRSGCDKDPRYFYGTASSGGVVEKVYRCSCGATELRADATSGEILEGKVS